MPVFSQATSRVRSFLYRSPRYKADIPMDYIVADAVVLGTCADLSESGLRGTFSIPVPTKTIGLLTLYHAGESFQVHARIDSFQDDQARLRFEFDSKQEREAIKSLIGMLVGTQAR